MVGCHSGSGVRGGSAIGGAGSGSGGSGSFNRATIESANLRFGTIVCSASFKLAKKMASRIAVIIVGHAATERKL